MRLEVLQLEAQQPYTVAVPVALHRSSSLVFRPRQVQQRPRALRVALVGAVAHGEALRYLFSAGALRSLGRVVARPHGWASHPSVIWPPRRSASSARARQEACTMRSGWRSLAMI